MTMNVELLRKKERKFYIITSFLIGSVFGGAVVAFTFKIMQSLGF